MKKDVLLIPALFQTSCMFEKNSQRFHLKSLKRNSPYFLIKAVLACAMLIFLTGFSVNKVMAQPTIEWENTIQATEEEEFAEVKQTADGGYILGGTSSSNAGLDKTENSRGSADYWIVKLNAAGVKEWDKRFGGNDIDYLTSINQTADGGYIVGGWSDSGVNGDKSESNRSSRSHTWILKLNADGIKEWDKTIEVVGSKVEQTADGGYIVGGNGLFMKLNSSGEYVWVNTSGIAGNYFELPDDAGIIIISSTLATKLNAAGVKQWEQPLQGSSDYSLFRQTADGGYIMGAGVFGSDYKILKLSAAGNKEWEKIIGGNSVDDLRAIEQTADGGYILGGFSHSGASGDKSENNKGPQADLNNFYYSDYWIVKLDAAGNRVWDKTIGAIFHEQLRSLEQTADGGLIIGGRSESSGKANTSEPYASLSDKSENSSHFDYWVVKLSNVNTAPPTGICNLALTSKVTQAEPWYGMYPGGGGGIDLTVTGGTPPYNYTWNNFRNSPEDAPAPVLAPGVYTVVVTDAKGCTARGTVEVGKKNDPMRLHISSQNVTTTGDSIGSIDLSVVGGTGPYKYLWSNGATTEDLLFLVVGIYSVTVTDAFGKKAMATVNIINPRAPVPVVCNLVATSKITQAEPWYGMWGPISGAGAIDVTAGSGTAPYTYKWNTGATTKDIAVAAPGVYTLTITDAKACTTTTTVTVGRKNGPLTLAQSHTNVSTTGRSNGSIDLSVVGGTGPYRYRWSNGATTEDLTGLAAGTYAVTVTDAFNRTATISVQIIGASTTAIASAKSPTQNEVFTEKEASFSVYPNPAKDHLTINFSLPATGKYALELYDIRGAKVKTITQGQADARKVLNVKVSLGNLAEGIYLLKLQTDTGITTNRISVIR